MNRHKEKLNSILSRQKDYQRKGKCMLVMENFLVNVMSFCYENYGLILHKYSLYHVYTLVGLWLRLSQIMLIDRLSGERKQNQNR